MKKSNTPSPAEKLRKITDNYDNTKSTTIYVERAYAILQKWAEAGHYSVQVNKLDKDIDLLNPRLQESIYQRLREMGFEVNGTVNGLVISWEKPTK
jgi:hypothetical protein